MPQQRPSDDSPGTAPPPRVRLHYVDNLRVALTVLVVLHHAAVTYSHIPVWYYLETPQDASAGLLDVFVILNQTYFMGLFFLLAGFFVPASADRRGVAGHVRERLVRLGVPFLLFVVLLRPLLVLPGHEEGPLWLYLVLSYDPGPMWFVEVLLLFTLVHAAVRAVRGRRRAPAAVERPADGEPLRWLWPVVAFTVALGVVTFLWRWAFPAPYWPVVGLPSPGYVPQYAALFAVGAVAFRRNWAARLPGSAGWYGMATALAALAGYGSLLVLTGGQMADPGSVAVMAAIVLEMFLAVGAVLALVVFFRRFVDGGGPLARFLSDNAFAVYVLHPLVLVAGGLALAGWEAPAVAKFAVLGVLAVPCCWALAWAVRALPAVRRVL
ncbi:acyltransferase family protein [Nocardiopsis algeriensis]|uniref:acyltransferase family protein n=1 Tax=Nocardiopsis algeriensis TaxID=1478215 RepID=UPI003B432245